MDTALLESHGITQAEVELYYKDWAAAVARGEAARLLRVVAMSKRMHAAGLTPLGAKGGKTVSRTPLSDLSEAEQAGLRAVGLTWEEYMVIRGTREMLGLCVRQSVYDRLLRMCFLKKARALSDDREACQLFIAQKIRAIARKELARASEALLGEGRGGED